jgi:hypothetical protein
MPSPAGPISFSTGSTRPGQKMPTTGLMLSFSSSFIIAMFSPMMPPARNTSAPESFSCSMSDEKSCWPFL